MRRDYARRADYRARALLVLFVRDDPPSATNRFADASPIPLLPPVITAVFPCSTGMF